MKPKHNVLANVFFKIDYYNRMYSHKNNYTPLMNHLTELYIFEPINDMLLYMEKKGMIRIHKILFIIKYGFTTTEYGLQEYRKYQAGVKSLFDEWSYQDENK